MRVFIDTWAWVALVDRRDSHHEKAAAIYKQQVLKPNSQLFTSDYVIAESITPLRIRVGHERTMEWLNPILAAQHRRIVSVIRVDEELWNSAYALLKRFADKPDISFVDITSFAVMQKHGIVDVFTGDYHFEKVNLGFQILR